MVSVYREKAIVTMMIKTNNDRIICIIELNTESEKNYALKILAKCILSKKKEYKKALLKYLTGQKNIKMHVSFSCTLQL